MQLIWSKMQLILKSRIQIPIHINQISLSSIPIHINQIPLSSNPRAYSA